MRKSGPFLSMRLCAYTSVGADSGVVGVIAPVGDVLVEVTEAAGWLADLVDRMCQTKITSKRMQADTRTARRTRIPYHSMGTVTSQEGTVKPESMREKGIFVAWRQLSILAIGRREADKWNERS